MPLEALQRREQKKNAEDAKGGSRGGNSLPTYPFKIGPGYRFAFSFLFLFFSLSLFFFSSLVLRGLDPGRIRFELFFPLTYRGNLVWFSGFSGFWLSGFLVSLVFWSFFSFSLLQKTKTKTKNKKNLACFEIDEKCEFFLKFPPLPFYFFSLLILIFLLVLTFFYFFFIRGKAKKMEERKI